MQGSTFAMPLVAVVTPLRNGAKDLKETMESVQAQSYPNLVHVVLDNASSDATPLIIERFLHKRVPVLAFRSEMPLPMFENWNRAINRMPSGAAYFLTLCHNDLLVPHAIESLVKVAQSKPTIGVVGCRWSAGPVPNGPVERCGLGLPSDRSVFQGRWFIKSYLQQCHYATSPQFQLFPTTVLKTANPFYSDVVNSDIDACLRTLLTHDYGFVHAELGFTRCSDGGTTDTFVNPNRLFMRAWLVCLQTYGPHVMAKRELDITIRAFLEYYYRRLLVWRFWDRNAGLYYSHVAWLEDQGCAPTALDYAFSLANWCFLAAVGRRDLVSRPVELWAATRGELLDLPPVDKSVI